MASFELVEPGTIEEAFAALDSDDPAVRPIGGGTALMLMMKAQIFKPVRLVSLRRLGPKFHGIELSADRRTLRIGAMTTFAELEHSAEVGNLLPVIPQTMQTLANVRVRNVATVGGNLAHGDPHLDLPPVWAALNARVHVAGQGGERVVPVAEIFAGYYETTLAQGEVITSIEVPVEAGWRAHYTKVTTRSAHDWPAIGITASVKFDGNRIEDLRIVLSAAVDRPTRLTAAEDVLRGATVDDAVLNRAGEAAGAQIEFYSDLRGSADYKLHLLRVYLARTIRTLQGA